MFLKTNKNDKFLCKDKFSCKYISNHDRVTAYT